MRARLGTRSNHSSCHRAHGDGMRASMHQSLSGRHQLRNAVAAPHSCCFLCCVSAVSFAQSTFKITSATYTPVGETAYEGSNAIIPAGVNGAQLTLTGTLPTAATQSQAPVQGCFLHRLRQHHRLLHPAAERRQHRAIQHPRLDHPVHPVLRLHRFQQLRHSRQGLLRGLRRDLRRNLRLDAHQPVPDSRRGTLARRLRRPHKHPADQSSHRHPVGAHKPSACPLRGLLYYSAEGGTTTITFGSFGSVTLAVPTPYASVPVPRRSPPRQQEPPPRSASVTPSQPAQAEPPASAPRPRLPLRSLSQPSPPAPARSPRHPRPCSPPARTVLTAQFAKTATQTPAQPGAPSGQVTFVAPGATIPAAKLVLDPTATFAAKSTTLTIPAVATPVITPAAGSYLNSTSVSISDATSGATIYYTQDGSTPTTASPHYTSPFTPSPPRRPSPAIAALSAYLNSPAASAAYTITASPPTKLAFTVQPVDTASNIAITPAVQVAVQDANGKHPSTPPQRRSRSDFKPIWAARSREPRPSMR